MEKGQPGEYMRLRRFLLGQLPEDEREAIERRFFEDAHLFELLESIEDELIDEYARGSLKGDERKQWEEVLSGDRRSGDRLRFANSLSRKVGRRRSRMPGWLSWPVMVRWIVPVAVTVALIVGILSLRKPGSELKSADRREVGHPVVFALSLIPGTVRGADSQQSISIPSTAGKVRMTFQSSVGASRAVFRNVDNGSTFTINVRRAVAEVDAEQLVAGDYVATLLNAKGDELADYSFRIRRD